MKNRILDYMATSSQPNASNKGGFPDSFAWPDFNKWSKTFEDTLDKTPETCLMVAFFQP